MTKRKARIKLGKQIRKATGLPLPLAMLAARKVYRFEGFTLLSDPRFAGFIARRPLCRYDGCCGYSYILAGKSGEYRFYG